MPFLDGDSPRLHYVVDGPPEAPVLVLASSLGANLTMWDPQVRALGDTFRILRYDPRGHGRTTVAPGPCTVPALASDVLRLMDALGLERVHFCGLSMGGMVGMWLGAHAAGRVHRLVLCNTAPVLGTPEHWNARIRTVREEGMRALSGTVAERWFRPGFGDQEPEALAAAVRMLLETPVEGYVAACEALRDADERADAAAIRLPTLVIGGRHDPATPAHQVRRLAETIPGAEYVELETSHLSNLEAPDAFTAELRRFLGG